MPKLMDNCDSEKYKSILIRIDRDLHKKLRQFSLDKETSVQKIVEEKIKELFK